MSMLDVATFFDREFAEHRAVAEATATAMKEPFGRLLTLVARSIRDGGKILFFGNGGSAADSQHLATELTIRYKSNRAPIAAVALTTDTSALTAAGNDHGFETIFARQIQAIGRPGDVAIGITTSGRSPNVIAALQMARTMGIHAVAFSGGSGGALPGLADPLLLVPSTTTARIQEMHILLGQMLCGALELELGLVPA